MDYYYKTIAMIITGVVLWIVLEKQEKHISVLLTTAICCIAAIASAVYLKPVLDFIQKLMQLSQLNDQFLEILLKAAGIGLLSQIACFVCADAGNQALTKTLQVITTAVLLSISVPLLDQILSLLETILGEL